MKKRKVRDLEVTQDFLEARVKRASEAGYAKQKWIQFCEHMLSRGYQVFLYEARSTASKYLTVVSGRWSYKVRYSNHPPNRTRELEKDCDFFVGVTNFNITTTAQAVIATDEFFRRMTEYEREHPDLAAAVKAPRRRKKRQRIIGA